MDIPALDRDRAIRSYLPGRGLPVLLRDPGSGDIYVNPIKRYVKPFTLTTEPGEITLSPGQVSPPIPMVIDNQGHFEIIGAFFRSSQPEGFSIKMADANSQPLFQNRELHVDTIAAGAGAVTKFNTYGVDSSGGRMYRWPDSYWLKVDENSRAIHAIFRNLSALENDIYFELVGLRWYHTLAPPVLADQMNAMFDRRRRIRPFFYSTDRFVRLSVGQSLEFDVRFEDGPHTEWIKTTYHSSGPFNVLIEEKATRKSFMGNALPHDVVFGPGEFPFMLWESAVFDPNQKLSFTLTNTHSETNDIWISLGCRHLYL